MKKFDIIFYILLLFIFCLNLIMLFSFLVPEIKILITNFLYSDSFKFLIIIFSLTYNICLILYILYIERRNKNDK